MIVSIHISKKLALALIPTEENEEFGVIDIPTIKTNNVKLGDKLIDPLKLISTINDLRDLYEIKKVIISEPPKCTPNIRRFVFPMFITHGIIFSVIKTLGIESKYVNNKEWLGACSLIKRYDEDLIFKAQHEFPTLKDKLKKISDFDRCAALLMGKRYIQNEKNNKSTQRKDKLTK